MIYLNPIESGKMKKLIALFRTYSITAAYLFGSRVDGSAGAKSDYDLAVLLEEKPSLEEASFLMLSVQDEASRILKSAVDVVVLNSSTIEQRFLIISRGVLLYSGDDDIRTDFEDIFIRDYLDFKPFLDKYRQEVREAIKEGDFFA